VHSGEPLTDPKMKALMLEATSKLANWLIMKAHLKREAPAVYYFLVNLYRDYWQLHNWHE
jgi:hypothetical protein